MSAQLKVGDLKLLTHFFQPPDWEVGIGTVKIYGWELDNYIEMAVDRQLSNGATTIGDVFPIYTVLLVRERELA